MVVSRARILSDRSATGAITNTQSVVVSTAGCGVVSWIITGTWTGTLVFEASVDGINWESLEALPILPRGFDQTSTTTNGQWTFACGGLNSVRIRGSSVATGSATVYLDASQAGPEVQPTTLTFGPNTAVVNSDGSLDVNIVQSVSLPGLTVSHNEITSIASGVETTIITVTASVSPIRVQKVEVSGENVALFRVKVGGVTISDKRSWWGCFNQTFDYEDFENGLLLNIGQVLTVTVLHNRPTLANFEATVLSR